MITTLISLGATALAIAVAEFLYNRLTRTPFHPKGRRCLITGGSSGLGLGLAIELIESGAHVCIVARNQKVLEEALEEMKSHRRDSSQLVAYVSADVTSIEGVRKAFNSAETKLGGTIDFVCACAGASYPRYFLEDTIDDFDKLTRLNYLGQAYTAHEAATRMKDAGIKNGKIVFVSSVLGLISFIGWATYAPTKYAIRGLSDTLRNELKRYNIGVHLYLPGGILSPGFDTENKTKPKVTAEIEGANTPQTPKECAQTLLQGITSDYYTIVTDIVMDVLRATARGVSPGNYLVLDWIMAVIGQPIVSGYVRFMDYKVKSLRADE